jgi:hypothetical protein
MYGYAVPLVILAALAAFRWKVGMWGNCLSLGAMLFSVLIAIGWWEDVAELLVKQAPVTLFLADCIAVWVLFIVSLLILDTATRFLSSIKVKFDDTVEKVGNGIAIFLLFLVLYTFSTVIANEHLGMVGSNHGDPVPKSIMTDATFSMLRMLSAGNLEGFTETHKFDGSGEFQELHWKRRQALMLTMLAEQGQLQGTEDQAGKMKRRGRD